MFTRVMSYSVMKLGQGVSNVFTRTMSYSVMKFGVVVRSIKMGSIGVRNWDWSISPLGPD